MTLMTQAGIPDTVKRKCGWTRIACDHLYWTQLKSLIKESGEFRNCSRALHIRNILY